MDRLCCGFVVGKARHQILAQRIKGVSRWCGGVWVVWVLVVEMEGEGVVGFMKLKINFRSRRRLPSV